MTNTKQIFQTNSKLRWRTFQWAGSLILLAIVLMVPVVIVTLANGIKPGLPLLAGQTDSMHYLSHPAIPAMMNLRELKKYKGYNDFLTASN